MTAGSPASPGSPVSLSSADSLRIGPETPQALCYLCLKHEKIAGYFMYSYVKAPLK